MKEYTGLTSTTRCIKCGKTIAIVKQFYTDKGWYGYEYENLDCRFIDKWGIERNFCKACIK